MISSWLDFILSDIQNAPALYLIIWAMVGVYPILLSFLTLGFLRNRKTKEVSSSAIQVTVLVSARNEEEDLPRCIQSLLKIDYPKDKLQIVLVNDQSDDLTEKIIQSAASEHRNVFAVNTADFPANNLKAKAKGVNSGMKVANGEWVFITDADAEVHPKWIKHSLSVVEEDTGMIGGALIIKPEGILGIIERVCWAFVQMFNLGMSGWGASFVCVGPNMAIRKSIYDACGGLEKSNFSVAEDLALFNMVKDAGKKIITFVSKETAVTLTPVPSYRHLISQQRRWFRGGIENGAEYIWILYSSFWWGFALMLYFWIGWIISVPVYLAFWTIKVLLDLGIFIIQKKKLKLDRHVRYLPFLELYHLFIFIYLPISFLFTKKIHWMGKGFNVEFD